ncbi:hypothetical protein P3W33_05595 [Luteibacter sp. PPL552]
MLRTTLVCTALCALSLPVLATEATPAASWTPPQMTAPSTASQTPAPKFRASFADGAAYAPATRWVTQAALMALQATNTVPVSHDSRLDKPTSGNMQGMVSDGSAH